MRPRVDSHIRICYAEITEIEPGHGTHDSAMPKSRAVRNGWATPAPRVASELEPQFRFLKVDTEAEPELSARYQIRSIPTLMVFKNGAIVAQQAGAMDSGTLRNWLKQVAG